MSTKEIKAEYTTTYLFPPSLEDWIGADHPARFLREVISELNLAEYGFRVGTIPHGVEKKSGQGRPHYGDELLLKAWLYGYMNGIRSSRKLEKACRENLGLIWLLGREEPDHNTLWRFWKRNRRALREVFRGVVRIGLRAELLGMILHAVDGTKLQAYASSQSKEVLREDKLRDQLKAMEETLDRMEEEIEEGGEDTGEGYRLPEELQDQKKLREKIRESLRILQEEETQKVNRREREARVMKLADQKRLGYNAQAVVDEESKMVVAEEVVNATTDQHELGGMLEKVEANLGETAEDTVADKGYRSDEAIGKASQKGHSVLVHLYDSEMPTKAGPYHKCHFQYDESADVFICPEAKKLAFKKKVKQRRQGWEERLYQCQDDRECEKRSECCKGSTGRTVTLGPYWKEVQEQRERQQEPEDQEKLGKRKAIVELFFGQIKHNQNFRRYTFRGLSGVRTQWSFLCTAYNLNKLYRSWKEGKLTFEFAV